MEPNTPEKDLAELRALLRGEIQARLARHGGFGGLELAEQVLNQDRELVIRGLAGLVHEEVERYNDEDLVRRLLKEHPERRRLEAEARELSEAMSQRVPAIAILMSNSAVFQACREVAQLVDALHVKEDQRQRKARRESNEYLKPLVGLYGDLPAQELLGRLKADTDRTLGRIEDSDDQTEE